MAYSKNKKVNLSLVILIITLYYGNYGKVVAQDCPNADDKVHQMLIEDQAIRNSKHSQSPAVYASDKIRRDAVVKMITSCNFSRPVSYAEAGLILDHSDNIDDNETARDLFVLSAFLHGSYSSFPALAEDRILIKLKQLQRFGSQYLDFDPFKLECEVETGESSVNDFLRADYLLPSMQLVRQLGVPDATSKSVQPNVERIKKVMTKTGWVNDIGISTINSELKNLLHATLSNENKMIVMKKILNIYNRENVWTPDDYCTASQILIYAAYKPSHYLLANELAAISVMRMNKEGWKFYAKSWDLFLESIKQEPRYINKLKFKPLQIMPLIYCDSTNVTTTVK